MVFWPAFDALLMIGVSLAAMVSIWRKFYIFNLFDWLWIAPLVYWYFLPDSWLHAMLTVENGKAALGFVWELARRLLQAAIDQDHYWRHCGLTGSACK